MNEERKSIIKIRTKYRDMLRDYCNSNGDKMYILAEKLIERHCNTDTSQNRLPVKNREMA